MKSKHSNIKVPNKTVKPEGSFKLPPPKSVSIQHSFAEIVNECVKSDDEVDFTLHTVHYDGQSDDATDPISTEHITTLSSMDSFSHDVEVQVRNLWLFVLIFFARFLIINIAAI